MKFLLVLAFLLTPAFAEDTNPPPHPEGTVPGRFQLFSIPERTESGEVETKLYRIDTATGKVWYYGKMPLPLENGSSVLLPAWGETTEEKLALKRLERRSK